MLDQRVEPITEFWLRLGVLFALASYGSSASQIVVFLTQPEHEPVQYLAVVVLFLSVARCLRVQLTLMPSREEFNEAYSKSLLTGFMDPYLRQCLSDCVCSKHCMAMLFVPFFTLNTDLDQRQAFLQAGSFFLAVKSMMEEDVGSHLGDELRQLGKAIIQSQTCGSLKIIVLQAWCFCNHSGSLALHALVMDAVHPAVAFALLVPASFVRYCHMGNTEFGEGQQMPMWWWLRSSWAEPITLFTFQASSIFSLPLFHITAFDFENRGNKSAWPMFVSQMVRLLGSTFLLVSGLSVELQEAYDKLLDTEPYSEVFSGQQLFRLFLILLAVSCVPVYTMSLPIMMCSQRAWRSGEENSELFVTMIEMTEGAYLEE